MPEAIHPEPLIKPQALHSKDVKRFFASRADKLHTAERLIKASLITSEDGEYLKMFILAEVDHWNHDRERIVIMCTNAMLIVNFCLINESYSNVRRIPITSLRDIIIGNMVFPSKTLQGPRGFYCIKIMANSIGESNGTPEISTGVPKTSEVWNPLSKNIPWIILTAHPLAKAKDDELLSEPWRYSIDSFQDALLERIAEAQTKSMELASLEIRAQDIEMPVHLGLTSLLTNQGDMGFAKDRGGFYF